MDGWMVGWMDGWMERRGQEDDNGREKGEGGILVKSERWVGGRVGSRPKCSVDKVQQSFARRGRR